MLNIKTNKKERGKFKMKKLVSLILALVMIVGAMFTFAACEKDKDPTETAKPKLVVATSPDFPPFEFLENGNVVGIEVEIMQIICDRLGYELVIEQIDFDSVIPGVQTKKYMCGMSGITATPERAQNVLFTEVYYVAAQAIVVRADSPIQSKADLAGKKMSVQEGTTAEDFCLGEYGVNFVEGYKANPDAKSALTSGKVDAWVVDDLTAKQMCEGDETVKILDESMTEEPYAFAFNFDDEALVMKIDPIIEELIADGTIKGIFEKYGEAYSAPKN
jgi:polar amino acid transport system substrate-binding protein